MLSLTVAALISRYPFGTRLPGCSCANSPHMDNSFSPLQFLSSSSSKHFSSLKTKKVPWYLESHPDLKVPYRHPAYLTYPLQTCSDHSRPASCNAVSLLALHRRNPQRRKGINCESESQKPPRVVRGVVFLRASDRLRHKTAPLLPFSFSSLDRAFFSDDVMEFPGGSDAEHLCVLVHGYAAFLQASLD